MHSSPSADSNSSSHTGLLGTLCLIGAAGIAFLAFADGSAGLPIRLPASWYTFRFMWYLLGIGLFLGGSVLLKQSSITPEAAAGIWHPGQEGKRFETVRLYTRRQCHLCDDAKQLLVSYLAYLPAIDEIDIDEHPEFREQFTTCVPVVEIDGQVRFRGQVNETLLRRLIEGTPPRE